MIVKTALKLLTLIAFSILPAAIGYSAGMVLRKIDKKSDLFKAGLREGDTLLSINGTIVTIDNSFSLFKSLKDLPSVTYKYMNDKKEVKEVNLSLRESK